MEQFKPLVKPIFEPFWATKFTYDELKFLCDELDELQNNQFRGAKKMNDYLVGSIEHEFRLSPDTHNKLEELLNPLLHQQVTHTKFETEFTVLNSQLPVILQDTWVNFQKKNEYNPVHAHSGVFSFVLWLKIPYNREAESKHPGSKGTNGNFVFYLTDQAGKIQDYPIQLDKSYEGVCVMFPAETRHCVYPFYTSDEYRISVSGNYVLKAS
tara:strand:- start:304 stop:936 length:633 start_codon:yes stop_codon:yes gene_type:complete